VYNKPELAPLINLKISEDSCLFATVSVGCKGYLVYAMWERESFDNFIGDNLTGYKICGSLGLSQLLSLHL